MWRTSHTSLLSWIFVSYSSASLSMEVPVFYLNHPADRVLTLGCPGARPNMAVAWDRGSEPVYRSELSSHGTTPTRLLIDTGHHLVFTPAETQDSGTFWLHSFHHMSSTPLHSCCVTPVTCRRCSPRLPESVSVLFAHFNVVWFSHCESRLFDLIRISVLLIRGLLLLAAGSPGCRDTPASLRPFGAWTAGDITSWFPGGCQHRVNIVCCHDGCFLPPGDWQSWSQTPQRRWRKTCGLNSFQCSLVVWCPPLPLTAIIILFTNQKQANALASLHAEKQTRLHRRATWPGRWYVFLFLLVCILT